VTSRAPSELLYLINILTGCDLREWIVRSKSWFPIALANFLKKGKKNLYRSCPHGFSWDPNTVSCRNCFYSPDSAGRQFQTYPFFLGNIRWKKKQLDGTRRSEDGRLEWNGDGISGTVDSIDSGRGLFVLERRGRTGFLNKISQTSSALGGNLHRWKRC